MEFVGEDAVTAKECGRGGFVDFAFEGKLGTVGVVFGWWFGGEEIEAYAGYVGV